MVCANYCTPYPKQLYVVYEANMWCLCCMTSSVLESSTKFSQVSWSVLWLCHQVTDMIVWPINSNPIYSKNWKLKNKSKRKENKSSPASLILTLLDFMSSSCHNTSCLWDISKQKFYSYWWPDISVVCCHFVHSIYMQIALIWSFTAQLSLWKLVY